MARAEDVQPGIPEEILRESCPVVWRSLAVTTSPTRPQAWRARLSLALLLDACDRSRAKEGGAALHRTHVHAYTHCTREESM